MAASLAMMMLAGCGSTSLSGGELRSQATRICQLATRQTDQVPVPATPSASATFLKRGIAVLGPELRALRTLRPPAAAASDYSRSLSALAGQVAALQDSVRDMANGEDGVIAMKSLQRQLAPIEARGNESWRALGIPACLSS